MNTYRHYIMLKNVSVKYVSFYIPVKFMELSDVHQIWRAMQGLKLRANFYEARISNLKLNGCEQLCNFNHSTQMFEANLYENHILCKLI